MRFFWSLLPLAVLAALASAAPVRSPLCLLTLLPLTQAAFIGRFGGPRMSNPVFHKLPVSNSRLLVILGPAWMP